MAALWRDSGGASGRLRRRFGVAFGGALAALFPRPSRSASSQLPPAPRLPSSRFKTIAQKQSFFRPPRSSIFDPRSPAPLPIRATPPRRTNPPKAQRTQPKTAPALPKTHFPPQIHTTFLTKRTQTRRHRAQSAQHLRNSSTTNNKQRTTDLSPSSSTFQVFN